MYAGGGMKVCHSLPSSCHASGAMATKQSEETARTAAYAVS